VLASTRVSALEVVESEAVPRSFRSLVLRSIALCLALPPIGCWVTIVEGSDSDATTSETAGDGDGDGDGSPGDGDGSPGDGDGSPGDGDGSPGDGDGSPGDGDGDGDGDGSPGDGDGDGDGDGSPGVDVGVEVGGMHTCARLGPEVWCWGAASVGQLGYANYDTIGDDEPPSEAGPVMVGDDVVALTTGDQHTCVITAAAGLRCWGLASNGRLGYANYNNIGDDEVPAVALDVPVGIEVLAVSAGFSHTCVLGPLGQVRCFGNGSYLGYGDGPNDIGDNETPASAGDVPIGGAATTVACGGSHTCAIMQGGSVRCWGNGGYGALGYANTNTVGVFAPAEQAGDVMIGGPAVQLSLGVQHSCARLQDGSVRCWGNGGSGKLGYANTNTIGDDETPASAGPVPVGGAVIDIAAGDYHTCALLQTGDVRCWGANASGQLGYANTQQIGDNETPDSVGPVDLGGPAIDIAAGNSVSCAVRDTGDIYCWGTGGFGALGHADTQSIGNDETPAAAGPVML
jgi:alpha-tubulin suppressor-like RCC1 family protein